MRELSKGIRSQHPDHDGAVGAGQGARGAANRQWRGWWCVLVVLWTFCATFAQSEFAQSEETYPDGQFGVLLLEGNRLEQGRITLTGETYSVAQGAGTLVIAKQQVRFIGTSMRDVYVHLQDTLPTPATPADHVELARWCISYRMMPEARFELQAALELDPSRDDIRRNLNQLDSLLKRPPPEAKPVKSMTPSERMAKLAVGAVQDVESLGGLSREAGQQFTQKIQPILMHTCAASACHGTLSDQPFKLTLVHPGSRQMRSTTEKNLLALLPYIDREQPKASPLWKLLKNNHGAIGSSIFLGPRGKDQLETVQAWLLSLKEVEEDEPVVARPKSTGKVQQAAHQTAKPRYQKGVRPPAAPAATVVQAQGAKEAPAEPVATDMRRRTASRTEPRARRNTLSDSAPPASEEPSQQLDVEPIVSEEPPVLPDPIAEDPFNPEEFNSRQRTKKSLAS